MNRNKFHLRNVVAMAACLSITGLFWGCCPKADTPDDLPKLQHERGILIDGKIWATRNLATDYIFVDNPEDYGALYQWGRNGDGHEQRNSPRYPTNDDSNENGMLKDVKAYTQITKTHPAYGKFIKQLDVPGDWRAHQWTSLWWALDDHRNQVKAWLDPCPYGWRLPTDAEFDSLFRHTKRQWGELDGVQGWYLHDFGNEDEKLFLPAAGYRMSYNGVIVFEDIVGVYWTSNARCAWKNSYEYEVSLIMEFSSNSFGISDLHRAYGCCVRCIEDRK